jgi:hypothetical protein
LVGTRGNGTGDEEILTGELSGLRVGSTDKAKQKPKNLTGMLCLAAGWRATIDRRLLRSKIRATEQKQGFCCGTERSREHYERGEKEPKT